MMGANPFAEILEICLRNTPWRTLDELRSAVDERNLNFVQSLFPQDLVQMEALRGFGRGSTAYDRSAFAMVRNQEQVCRGSNCVRCPYSGHMYDVFPNDEGGVRGFYVDFAGRCPRWVRIAEASRPKEEPVRSGAGIGFGE